MSTTGESNRGVPKTELIVSFHSKTIVSKFSKFNFFVQEDVESWLAKEKFSVEEAEVVIREKYGKYKYCETSMHGQRTRMADKIPEFDNSLSIIDTLIAKRAANESFETTFMLSDDVYTKAVVQKPETVRNFFFISEKSGVKLRKSSNPEQKARVCC